MAIKWQEDLGAPLAVTAVNIIARKSIPKYYDWVVYGVTAAAYVMAFMDKGGEFVKKVGIAELPLAADKLYSRITTGTTGATSSIGRIARYPAPAYSTEFQGLRME